MKFFMLSSLLIGLTFCSFAQTKSDSLSNRIQQQANAVGQGGNNELKFNVLFGVLGLPEITYERIDKINRGYGAALVIGADNEYRLKFAITPFYRWYFGKQKANGFFIEGNMNTIFASKSKYDSYEYNNFNRLRFSVGAAVGAKFFTRNGFFGETYLGLGRAIGARYYYHNYPRLGIIIGKRLP